MNELYPPIAAHIRTEWLEILPAKIAGTLGNAESPAAAYLDFMRYNVNAIVEELKSIFWKAGR